MRAKQSGAFRRRVGNNRYGFNMKKPVELEKEYEAEIENISRRHDGVTEIKGFTLFVPNAKQEEHVKFKITRVGSSACAQSLI